MIGLRYERLNLDGEVESILEIGPFVTLGYTRGVLVAYHEDGMTDTGLKFSGRWRHGKQEYDRLVVFPWPGDED